MGDAGQRNATKRESGAVVSARKGTGGAPREHPDLGGSRNKRSNRQVGKAEVEETVLDREEGKGTTCALQARPLHRINDIGENSQRADNSRTGWGSAARQCKTHGKWNM
ncbi:unnamed protein product [Prorocentrum cordatum]|uniref:Uncharacterized protein n=1 Tax=Prorocentrum cordatum TaxID=2364126 RepID=A0ABN9PWF4_9DINO|nr:unnamed protein product [Polarella glacialis]